MDKFKSVLKDMGIELEFVPQDQPERSPSATSPSVRSSGSSPDQTGTFPVSPFYNGRRRRNSDTAAPSLLDYQRGAPAPSNRARSVSPTASRHPAEELPSVRGVGGVGQLPLSYRWAQHDETDAPEDEDVGEDFTQDLPVLAHRAPVRGGEPTGDLPQGFDYFGRRPPSHDEPTGGLGLGYFDQSDTEHRPISRAEDGSDRFVGASDTTAQSWDDGLPYRSLDEKEHAALEGKVQAFRNHVLKSESARATGAWRAIAHQAFQRHGRKEFSAVQVKEKTALTRAVSTWRENAIMAREDRLMAAGPYLNPAKKARMERRADRAYSILLLHKAFTHWVACTRDETNRTAVARRHILRKRCFSAWRSQQSADEAKVRDFRLQSLVRLWSRASIHHEVRAEVAIQSYRHNLVKTVFGRWRAEYLARLADELRTCRIKERCLAIWLTKSREATALYEGCAVYDERLLLDEALATWRAEHEETRMFASGCIRQKLALDCQRILEEWRTEATLRRLLSSFTEARHWQTKQHTIDVWASSASEVRQKASIAKKMVLQELITHWENETKLKRFEDSVNEQRKTRAMCHWILERKLVNFRRSSEERTKAQTLTSFRAASSKANARSGRGRQVADYFALQTVQASVIGKWWTSLEAHRRHQKRATLLFFHNTASQRLDLWLAREAEAFARTSIYEERAKSGAYYCTATNALSLWSATAAQASRERLTRTYHAAKRQYRVNLATRCMSNWRKATGDALALGWYADEVCISQQKAKLGEHAQHWNTCAKRLQVVREVAAGAELEVWWGRWSVCASQQRETELDAAEYNSVQTLLRCWRSWDFSALQCKGRRNTVATLRQKNDQRLRRQILSVWSHEAGLEGTFQDMRSSSMSRRSLRHGSARQGSRFHQPETPRHGSSVNHPSSQSSFQQLSYIPEADERKTSERGFAPSLQLRDLRGSRDLYQSLAHRHNRHSGHGEGLRSTAPQRFRSEGPIPKPPMNYPEAHFNPGPYGSPIDPIRDTPRYEGSTPHVPPRGYGSPGQLGPMSDFDEEESFSPGEEERADSAAAFMSTPSRFAGSARQQQGIRPTTTPSAILSTPFERALREEYGGGVAAAGRTATRETPRVTFADIREESAEYEEGYGG